MSAARTPLPDRLLSGEDLLALGDVGPCELIDGRIVPMSPTGGEHALLEMRLARALGNFVEARRLGGVVGGEVGIYTRRNPDRVRGADLAFVSREVLPERPRRGFLEVPPDLVVEILSPDDCWQDVRAKIDEYLSIGVFRVWVVEPENRAVLVFRSASESTRLNAVDTLAGEGRLEGFAVPLADLFAE